MRCFNVAKCLLAVVLPTASAIAQPQDPAADVDQNPERRKILQLIFQTNEAIGKEQFLQAAELFDGAWELAMRHEDPLLTINTDVEDQLAPGEHRVRAGARSRLEQLFETSPEAFQHTYRQQVAQSAKAAIQGAFETTYLNDVVAAILRYQFTTAAQQAMETVVQVRISRGEFLQAALQFGKLLRLRNDTSVEQTVALSVLWWKAGLPEEAGDYLAEVVRTHPAGLVNINGQSHKLPDSVAEISTWLATHFQGAPRASGWHQPLGNYRRTMVQDVGPPVLERQWSHYTFQDVENEDLATLLKPLTERLEDISDGLLHSGNSVMPVAVPLLVGDLLIYRGFANIRAVHRVTGEFAWETFKIDNQFSKALALQRRMETEDSSRVLRMLTQPLFQHWFRANVGGQLTTDGTLVFAVEDATAETMQVDLDSHPIPPASPFNWLRAYDLKRDGSLAGLAGGAIGAGTGSGKVAPLAGMYFLGAPLLMGDRIYVMSENDQGIFLLQLKATEARGPDGEFDMRPVRSQLLSTPRHPLRLHPVRKYAGLIPSYSRGLLICNTCDERVIAVSAEDHSVRWIYRYPSNVAEHELGPGRAVIGNAFNPQQSDAYDLFEGWRDALPRITDGRVLLTPRDSDRLICLDLSTGKELWTRPRGGLRRIAMVRDGAVVLTGRNTVESLDLESGKRNWATQLEEGTICGMTTESNRLLQIPTSTPAIVTLDSETGRVLLVQRLEGAKPPGNLLTSEGVLYSHSLSKVSSFGVTSDNPDSAATIAAEHLLKRDVAAAVHVLEKAVQPNSSLNPVERNRSLQLLIDTQLESLRLDYAASAHHIPNLRKLIAEMSPADDQLTRLIQMMVGMTLGDVASLPAQWNHADKAQRFLDRLHDLETRGQLHDPNVSPQTLAERIVAMLTESATSRDRYVTAGSLTQRGHRVPAAAIRAAMSLRSASDQQNIRRMIEPRITERMGSSSSPEESVWWINMCMLSGFPDIAQQAVMSGQLDLPPLFKSAVRDLLLMTAVNSESAPAHDQHSIDALLSSWANSERWLDIRDLLQQSGTATGLDLQDKSEGDRTRATANDSSVASVVSDFRLPIGSALSDSAKAIQKDADKLSRPTPWQGVPGVIESEAHAGGAPHKTADSAHRSIPLFGPAGGFSNWNFLKNPASSGIRSATLIHAYDGDGRHRWAFDPGAAPTLTNRWSAGSYNRLSDQYLCAYGFLLAVKLGPQLSMLDCSGATNEVPPRLLWSENVASLVGNALPSQNRSQAWQGTTQYDIQPSGLFPAGPITRFGIPVYSGRQMVMLNILTGHEEWKVNGLPSDCTIAADDNSLLLMSESAGLIQVRDPVDGSLSASHPLPDWWVQANENSNASTQTFQLEPGEQQRFRVALRGRFCVLFRMGSTDSGLELFDLAENRFAWTTKLPADSVASNIVNGHVAVLSEGNQLKIFDVVTRQLVSDVSVTAAAGSQYLYLRRGRSNWLVLTSCLDQKFGEQNPVTESVQVNGQLYAIDRSSGDHAWTTKIDHEWVRTLHPSKNPGPTVSPLLILLKRPTEQLIPRAYNGRIFDVQTGQLLYEDHDLGRDLSWHYTTLREQQNAVDIAFDKRTITFDYNLADPR
jgi:outer membrane protein assembly factor BamB